MPRTIGCLLMFSWREYDDMGYTSTTKHYGIKMRGFLHIFIILVYFVNVKIIILVNNYHINE